MTFVRDRHRDRIGRRWSFSGHFMVLVLFAEEFWQEGKYSDQHWKYKIFKGFSHRSLYRERNGRKRLHFSWLCYALIDV